MTNDLRDHPYCLTLVRGVLGLGRAIGYTFLAVVWLACLAALGLAVYERWLGLLGPSHGIALAMTLVPLGLSLHVVAWLPPFPQLERLWWRLWRKVWA